jgi:acyl-CoA reductase-like NAD-dependent aldehyde dehydrogenase
MLDMIIGGATAPTRDRFEVLNPSTGAVVDTAPDATAVDLDRAVAAAPGWAARPDAERAALSAKVAAKIAEGLFRDAFLNNGQIRAAMKRLYVHDAIHDAIHDAVCDALVAFAEEVPVGDGLDEGSVLGPVPNRPRHAKVSALVAGLSNGRALVDEEQFGPALPIIRYADVEEAIAAANDSPNGLGGSVWSRDIDAAKAVGRRLECGSVWINRHGAIQPNVPFGGVKQSGFGVRFAEEGLKENTSARVVFS